MPLEYIGAPPVASDRQARPFSPAVRAGDFIHVSSQVSANADGEIVVGGIGAQTRQVMENLKKVLALAGATLDDVCKSTVWLHDARETLVPSTASRCACRSRVRSRARCAGEACSAGARAARAGSPETGAWRRCQPSRCRSLRAPGICADSTPILQHSPYAPELNPVKAIWAYPKKHEIANLCLNTMGEVGQFARNRLKSMQRRPALINAFWKQAELGF